jgi:hypothetical protein
MLGRWGHSVATIDAWAAQSPEAAAAAVEIRKVLLRDAGERWTTLFEGLTRRGVFEEGDENWRRIFNETSAYLDAVAGIEGVGAEAAEWRDRAKAALESGG